jgi:hypothetical protein
MKDLHGPRPLDHLAEIVADARETPAPIGMSKGVAGLAGTVEGYTVGAFVQIVTVVAAAELPTGSTRRR